MQAWWECDGHWTWELESTSVVSMLFRQNGIQMGSVVLKRLSFIPEGEMF